MTILPNTWNSATRTTPAIGTTIKVGNTEGYVVTMNNKHAVPSAGTIKVVLPS